VSDTPEHMPDEIQMLTQPLMTEEGFLNEACMNELAAAINNMPESYERLADKPEWSIPAWVSVNEIVGLLANWAIRQAVGVPPKLVDVVGFVHAAIDLDERFTSWGDDIGKFAQLSLCDVNRLLWEILGDLQPFNDWNDANIMGDMGLQWIDLSAVLHNVCISLRNQRRHDAAFDAEFEKEHGS